jgi:hypothetical protein
MIPSMWLSWTLKRSSNMYPLGVSQTQDKIARLHQLIGRMRIPFIIIIVCITFYLMISSPTFGLTMTYGGALMTSFPFAMATSGTLLLAPRVSGAIAREHTRGTYELVRLTGLGGFGASWAIAARCLQGARIRRRSPPQQETTTPQMGGRFRYIFVLLGIWGAATAGFALLALLESLYRQYFRFDWMRLQWLVATTHCVTFLAAIILEYEATPVIGSIIGMLTPTIVRRPLNAEIAAFLIFLAVEVINYGIVYLVGFVLLGNLVESIIQRELVDIVTPLLRFIIFFLVREGTIYGLWTLLNKRLDAQQPELDLAFRLRL